MLRYVCHVPNLSRCAPMALACAACSGDPCPRTVGWQYQDVVSSADLHAVMSAYPWGNIAVGDDGTIVRFSLGPPFALNPTTEVFSTFELPTAGTLRGVVALDEAWWVVGDSGTVAVSNDHGDSWTRVDLNVAGDFYAVRRIGGSLVAVGDDVLRVLDNGEWVAPEAPEGGWGSLRDVTGLPVWSVEPEADILEVVAVGLDGRIVSSSAPLEVWSVEDSNTSTHLNGVVALGPSHDSNVDMVAVGDAGTILHRTPEGWVTVPTNLTSNLLGWIGTAILTDAGEVLFDSIGKLERWEGVWLPGALGFVGGSTYLFVGEGGEATLLVPNNCEG
jgi:hypothetical protein